MEHTSSLTIDHDLMVMYSIIGPLKGIQTHIQGKEVQSDPYKSSRGFGSSPGGFSQPQSYGRSNNRWNGQSSGGMGDSFSGDNFQFRPRSKRGDLLFGR